MTADWIPAKTGDALLDIDTPALVLDLDRFELNLGRLMEVAKAAGVRVRPHAKSHKCVEIARRQMAAGAVGVCCQKLSEAAVFLDGGISDVLITNEVVGPGEDRAARATGGAPSGQAARRLRRQRGGGAAS